MLYSYVNGIRITLKRKMINRKVKGSNAERELIHNFHKKGFSVIRAAGSGNTTLPSPDLFISRKGLSQAIEAKTSNNNTIPLKLKQVQELIAWSDNVHFCTPYIYAKVNRKGWYRIKALKALNYCRKRHGLLKEDFSMNINGVNGMFIYEKILFT